MIRFTYVPSLDVGTLSTSVKLEYLTDTPMKKPVLRICAYIKLMYFLGLSFMNVAWGQTKSMFLCVSGGPQVSEEYAFC